MTKSWFELLPIFTIAIVIAITIATVLFFLDNCLPPYRKIRQFTNML